MDALAPPRWQTRVDALLLGEPRYLLPALAVGYFVLWAALLTIGKWAQDIHFDSAEAYAWGQQLAWGYGKHPPVSGWIAWAWFSIFPARDFAMYALAMAMTGATFALLWLLARQIVDRERALFTACLLLVYPLLNFKGYKYNADLALMPFVVLVVLVFTIAFEKRTVWWGVALGLAGALAMLTKYWGGWAILGVALAALLSPDRQRFFLSPVPYVAGVVFIIAMIPHVLWLLRADFSTLYYASGYADSPEGLAVKRALTGTGQALVLLAPVALAGVVALWPLLVRPARNDDASAIDRLRNLWVIVAVMAILPPITAALIDVRMKSDWAIPMYTMVPLAVVALPRLAVTERAVARAAVIAFAYCAIAALVVPLSNPVKYHFDRKALLPKQLDMLAETVTDIWHQRFGTKLPVVVGGEPYAAPITFYSPDHPRLFTQADPRLAPWIDPGTLDQTGFLGICPSTSDQCEPRIRKWRADLQRLEVKVERASAGGRTGEDTWIVLLAPPQPNRTAQSAPVEAID